MNIRFAVLILGFAVVGCTKHNPAVCCNTPTQYSNFGLDGVTGCEAGKVCDADGACISPQCASSAECGSDTPYCASSGLCEMACTTDSECPGGGEASNQIHCAGGVCVECADAADCPASAPVCANSSCRSCQQNSECGSEVCASDGTCVATDMIAYVAPAGSEGADCSQATPCSLAHGVSLGRTYTLLAPGAYQLAQGLTFNGARWLIGSGAASPSVTRSSGGPIISVGVSSDLHVSHLVLSGATDTSSTSDDGTAISCMAGSLELNDVVVTDNAYNGVDALGCAVTATHCVFTRNGGNTMNRGSGLYVSDNTATIDSCDFSRNHYDGLAFDGTVVHVMNSFFTGNFNDGIEVSAANSGETSGGQIEFSTIAANAKLGLLVGIPTTASFSATNDLIAGNVSGAVQCGGGPCASTGTITLGADMSTAHFKSNFDFHITAGSVAIDAAAGSTLDHDFDGDVRPLGNGRDVGADEAQ